MKKEFNVYATINIDIDIEADTEEEAKNIVLWHLLRDYSSEKDLNTIEIEYID